VGLTGAPAARLQLLADFAIGDTHGAYHPRVSPCLCDQVGG
jgi:hypothetical protein